LFEGKKRAVIASEMQLASGEPMSEDTVRVYIDRLYRKADVHSLTDFALRITRIVFSLREAGSNSSASQP
jgi:DNA-binding NarL/FixJ family response regulator